MVDHHPVVREDAQGRYYGKCTCGQDSGAEHYPKIHRWKVEDWITEHNDQVELARAALGRARGTLKIERDHARKMLDDPNVSEHDKELWLILYDGAERRLRDSGNPDPSTSGLW